MYPLAVLVLTNAVFYLGSSLHYSFSSERTHLEHRNLIVFELLKYSLATSKHNK